MMSIFYVFCWIFSLCTITWAEENVSDDSPVNNGVLIRLGGEVLSEQQIGYESNISTATPISLDVVDMNIEECIRIFQTHSQQNIILSDGIQGKVSAHIQNIPWDVALWMVVSTNNWKIVDLGDIYIIVDANG